MSTVSFSVRAALCWALLLLAGCVDPYMPDAITVPTNYLVVDGFINCNGVSEIKLSRTYNISASTPPPRVSLATVYVEEESGPRYLLRESPVGTYTSSALVLNRAKRYRLRITTNGGSDYASEFVPAKFTPRIDSISWKAEDTGVGIRVNSHDASGTTQYYKWDYEETWEFAPLVNPILEYANGQIIPIRTRYPQRCWRNASSTAITQAKTTNLSQDVVSNFLLLTLPPNAERLRYKYSILVRQYAQTREEYAYWDLLKKNTENIGTLFDPLPSQLTGNIRCLSNPEEPVLGFIGAHSVEEKRIFIDRLRLPFPWRMLSGYEDCYPPDTVKAPQSVYNVLEAGLIPVFLSSAGYVVSTVDCVDCRRRGTATRPAFWQ
ncbi:hypothetical protein GCM10023185_09280 [Hymenobacter saemangeumensis]|uniref:DUF4249 domain-containing protein n=1 Tax=Hymenobacter saemangeumensis TaxID=1084522 RepID=A0ABP8I489_9BACT